MVMLKERKRFRTCGKTNLSKTYSGRGQDKLAANLKRLVAACMDLQTFPIIQYELPVVVRVRKRKIKL
jgi:hypothetical protein